MNLAKALVLCRRKFGEHSPAKVDLLFVIQTTAVGQMQSQQMQEIINTDSLYP